MAVSNLYNGGLSACAVTYDIHAQKQYCACVESKVTEKRCVCVCVWVVGDGCAMSVNAQPIRRNRANLIEKIPGQVNVVLSLLLGLSLSFCLLRWIQHTPELQAHHPCLQCLVHKSVRWCALLITTNQC